MGFLDYFRTFEETREVHKENQLRTHYYKARYDKCQEAVKRICTEMKMQVSNINNEFKEMLVKGSSYDLIFTFSNVTPLETAIDIKITTSYVIGMNRPKNKILKIYSKLDKLLPYKGAGLNP